MWGAIKKVINSDLNKSLDVLIQEKTTELGAHVTGNASTTNNHVSACRDQIQANIQTLLNGRVVKSVQRGTVEIPYILGSDNPLLVSINAVNSSKTAIFITNALGSINIFMRLINDTQLEFKRAGSTGTFVDWQVIEFY